MEGGSPPGGGSRPLSARPAGAPAAEKTSVSSSADVRGHSASYISVTVQPQPGSSQEFYRVAPAPPGGEAPTPVPKLNLSGLHAARTPATGRGSPPATPASEGPLTISRIDVAVPTPGRTVPASSDRPRSALIVPADAPRVAVAPSLPTVLASPVGGVVAGSGGIEVVQLISERPRGPADADLPASTSGRPPSAKDGRPRPMLRVPSDGGWVAVEEEPPQQAAGARPPSAGPRPGSAAAAGSGYARPVSANLMGVHLDIGFEPMQLEPLLDQAGSGAAAGDPGGAWQLEKQQQQQQQQQQQPAHPPRIMSLLTPVADAEEASVGSQSGVHTPPKPGDRAACYEPVAPWTLPQAESEAASSPASAQATERPSNGADGRAADGAAAGLALGSAVWDADGGALQSQAAANRKLTMDLHASPSPLSGHVAHVNYARSGQDAPRPAARSGLPGPSSYGGVSTERGIDPYEPDDGDSLLGAGMHIPGSPAGFIPHVPRMSLTPHEVAKMNWMPGAHRPSVTLHDGHLSAGECRRLMPGVDEDSGGSPVGSINGGGGSRRASLDAGSRGLDGAPPRRRGSVDLDRCSIDGGRRSGEYQRRPSMLDMPNADAIARAGGTLTPYLGKSLSQQFSSRGPAPLDDPISAYARRQAHWSAEAARKRSSASLAYDEACQDLAPQGIFRLTFRSPTRKFFILLAKSPYFNNFVLLMILANCITLAMSSSEPDWETTAIGSAISNLDYVFNAIFISEMLVKIMALGFVASPGTYLRDGWNVLDFVVVSLSVLGWLPGVSTGKGTTAVRTIRALRPLRTITRVPGLRKLVEALISSLPMMLDVLILLSFLFLLYGIVGVELLNGKMGQQCWPVANMNGTQAPAVPQWGDPTSYNWPGPFRTSCSGPMISDYPQRPAALGLACADGWWCGQYVTNNYGYTCFDNIGVAFLTVLYALTTSGWTDVMYEAMDSLSPAIWVFFCAIVITCSWFAANLAVAVLYVQFAVKPSDRALSPSEKKERTPEEEYAENDRLIPSTGPVGKLRRFLRKQVVERSWFGNLTVLCIIANTLLLGVVFYGMPDSTIRAIEVCNVILTAYFMAELAVKLSALGPTIYGQDQMNLFDALVVMFGILELILTSVGISTTSLTVLRCFRLLRVFKLARRWKELNRIMVTLLTSMSAISYLSMLMFLFVFIMAVLGMQVFGYQLIFCDQYSLGAAVQPVCPTGLSTADGSCPPKHYYDCYAPCAASQVDTWVTGAGGSYGWPGTPTGLCKAYGSPGTHVVNVLTTTMQPGAGGASVAVAKNTTVLQYPPDAEFWIWVGPSYVPRANFDDFLAAFTTVFQIMSTENWNNAAWDGMRSSHWMAALYYVFVILVGYYIFINLFLAILLDNFSSSRTAGPGSSADLTKRKKKPRKVRDEVLSLTALEPTPAPLLAAPTSQPGSPALMGEANGHAAPCANGDVPATAQASFGRDDGPATPAAGGAADCASTNAPTSAPMTPMSAHSYRDEEGGAAPRRIKINAHGEIDQFAIIGNRSNRSRVSDDGDRLPAGDSSIRFDKEPTILGGSNTGSKRHETAFAQSMRRADSNASFRGESSVRHSSRLNSSMRFGDTPVLTGLSCGLLAPDHPLRAFLAWVTHHIIFEMIIISVIVVSSLCLALDSPRLDPNSVTATALAVMNRVFIVVFVLEMLLKMVALDIYSARTAYLRSNWNILDCGIAMFGVIEWLLDAFPPANFARDPRNRKVIQAFRCVRALRPLRLAQFSPGMKVVLSALFQALAGIVNVGLVVALFFCMLAIVAMNLFSGQLYGCVWAGSAVQPYGDVGMLGLEQGDNRIFPPAIIDPASNVKIDKAWCTQGVHTITWPEGVPPYNLTHTWAPTYLRSFDHIGVAVLALFEMATTSLWLDVMYAGIDATGEGLQPLRDFNRSNTVFFILAMIVLWMVVLNLFVGVTIDKFVQLREKADGNKILLTFQQQQWVEVQSMLMIHCKPHSQTRKPRSPFRRRIYMIVTDESFEVFTMSIIGATVIILCMRHANQEPAWDDVQRWSNICISTLFACEALLKMIAFGLKGYYSEYWNCFDFLVVSVCFMGIGIDESYRALGITGGSSSSLSLIRVMRVGSIFRVIPKAKRLLKLFQTLIISLPALGNVGSVMLLFFYIFSVVGMNLFGSIRRNFYLKRHANWEDFPNSVLLLFRMTGGENWNGIMRECMNQISCILITDPTLPIYGNWYNKADPIWLDMTVDQWDDHCSPSSEGAMIFFLVVEVVLTYVLVNLFVAVILDNFQSVDAEELPITRAQVTKFLEVWADFDPSGTYFMPTPLVPNLIQSLEAPLGVIGIKDDRLESERVRSVIQGTAIPDHDGKVHIVEVLHALAARVAGTRLPMAQEEALYRQLAGRVPLLTKKVADAPRFTVAHYHAALFVQAAIRGYLARYARRTGQFKFTFAQVIKYAAMQARWKKKGTMEETLNKWRRASLMFVNRRRFARASMAGIVAAEAQAILDNQAGDLGRLTAEEEEQLAREAAEIDCLPSDRPLIEIAPFGLRPPEDGIDSVRPSLRRGTVFHPRPLLLEEEAEAGGEGGNEGGAGGGGEGSENGDESYTPRLMPYPEAMFADTSPRANLERKSTFDREPVTDARFASERGSWAVASVAVAAAMAAEAPGAEAAGAEAAAASAEAGGADAADAAAPAPAAEDEAVPEDTGPSDEGDEAADPVMAAVVALAEVGPFAPTSSGRDAGRPLSALARPPRPPSARAPLLPSSHEDAEAAEASATAPSTPPAGAPVAEPAADAGAAASDAPLQPAPPEGPAPAGRRPPPRLLMPPTPSAPGSTADSAAITREDSAHEDRSASAAAALAASVAAAAAAGAAAKNGEADEPRTPPARRSNYLASFVKLLSPARSSRKAHEGEDPDDPEAERSDSAGSGGRVAKRWVRAGARLEL